MTGIRILPSLDNASNNPVIDIICTQEETETRLTHCKLCDQFTQSSEVTICAATQCNISLMTTMKFKTCPKEIW